MPDREKVIKGLECCSEKQNCKECPYFCFNAKCQDDMNRDALSLLKEYDTQVQYRDDHIAEYEKEIKRLNKLLKEQEEKLKFLDALYNYINPNDMEQYMQMYRSLPVPSDGRS